MKTNMMIVAWNRPITGREKITHGMFEEFVGYLTELKSKGSITGFEPVMMAAHGGDMNGFFMIRGEGDKLHEIKRSDEWTRWMMRGNLHLDRFGMVDAFNGEAVQGFMRMWGETVAKL